MNRRDVVIPIALFSSAILSNCTGSASQSAPSGQASFVMTQIAAQKLGAHVQPGSAIYRWTKNTVVSGTQIILPSDAAMVSVYAGGVKVVDGSKVTFYPGATIQSSQAMRVIRPGQSVPPELSSMKPAHISALGELQ